MLFNPPRALVELPISRTPYAIITSLLSTRGPSGFYRGLSAFYVLCLKPSIQYSIYNRLKSAILDVTGGTEIGSAQAFLLGMISRAISTIAVFPYVRAKVMLQSSTSSKSTSILRMLFSLHEKDGVQGMFQGLGPELARGVLSAAVMLMVKERLTGVVRGLMSPK